MSKCWKCNKEFYSENLIRTLCDECLEKIPKTTATTDFGNLLNSEIKDLVDDFSKRKIAELEAKLAESEKSKEINIKERDKICLEMATDYNRQIIDLQSQLAITEKALELACETIKQMCGKPLWIGGSMPSPEPKDSKYFKDIAKEMLKNE